MSWQDPSPANPRISLIRPLLDLSKEQLRNAARRRDCRSAGTAAIAIRACFGTGSDINCFPDWSASMPRHPESFSGVRRPSWRRGPILFHGRPRGGSPRGAGIR